MAETAPTAGLSDHVMAVFVVPLTVAVNWLVWFAESDAVAGVTETVTGCAGGLSVIAADAFFVVSATLVAVIVTACKAVTDAGAVYMPLAETVPTAGLSDHKTAVLVVPPTVAVN